jgi:hypothetical protein
VRLAEEKRRGGGGGESTNQRECIGIQSQTTNDEASHQFQSLWHLIVESQSLQVSRSTRNSLPFLCHRDSEDTSSTKAVKRMGEGSGVREVREVRGGEWSDLDREEVWLLFVKDCIN